MRVLFLVVCLTISACAPSTDALIREANQSGNWSLVNQRLDAEEERRQASISQCNDGYLLMCSTTVGQSSCSCVVDFIAQEKLRRMTETFRAKTPRTSDNIGMRR